MEKEQASNLFKIYERAIAVLNEAEPVFRGIAQESERKVFVRAHTNLIVGLLTDLRAPLIRLYPELDTFEPIDEPENVLEPEEQAVVNCLTMDQIARIDQVLIESCAQTWRKVARVVGTAMTEIGSELPGVPDAFYAQRAALLVNEGRIESQGNLAYMRFSEVRLAS